MPAGRLARLAAGLAVLLALATPPASLRAQAPADTATVRVAGTGAETWVLLPGVMGGIAGFRKLESRLLARDARVVIVDAYRLSIDSADVSFTALARRVDRVLDRLGVTGARVVAHAHGAGVALRLAADAPQRVAELTFLDVGALVIRPSGVLTTSLRLVPFIVRMPGGRSFLRGRLVKGLRDNSGRDAWIDSAAQRAYTEPMLRNVDRAAALAFRIARSQEPEPVATVIPRVKVPVTLVLGTAPRNAKPAPGEVEALAPLGDRLRIERLAGVGHFIHEEAPDELLAILYAGRAPTVPR